MSQLKRLNSVRRRTIELKIQIFLSKYNSIKNVLKSYAKNRKFVNAKE